MPAPQLAVVADDLTGAGDTGGAFARHGLATVVSLGYGRTPPCDVLVVTTESRDLDAETAAHRAGRAAEDLLAQAAEDMDLPAWLYKKVDSTLRGHPAAELHAFMDWLGIHEALVAPAFPAQGRTTVGGRQLVDGLPIEQTAFRAEGATSDLLTLFEGERWGKPMPLPLRTVRQGQEAVVQALKDAWPGVVVADAETDDDLATLATAVAGEPSPLLCGSAGLASALTGPLGLRRRAAEPDVPEPHRGGVLAIAGSRHPRTAAQVTFAERRGVAVFRPDRAALEGDPAALDRIAVLLGAYASGGATALLSTDGIGDVETEPRTVASRLAEIIRAVAQEHPLGGLMLSGGDVAMAVCRALGASGVWVRGEVRPGIPHGVLLGGRHAGTPVVTKAGGFGEEDALVAALDHLEEVQHELFLRRLAQLNP